MVRALRLSLAWTLAIYGWFLRRECVSFASELSFLIDGSWDDARGGDAFAESLLWVMLAVIVGGLLLEMLPWRHIRSAGLALLLFLPCLSVISLAWSVIYNRQLPTPRSVAGGVAMSLTGFVLTSDSWGRAVALVLGPGLGLLLAAALSFWAVPRLEGRLPGRATRG